MEELLKRHIAETDRRFDEVIEVLKQLNGEVSNLRDFKTSMVVSSRGIALLVSSICGFLTMIATSLVSYLIQKNQ